MPRNRWANSPVGDPGLEPGTSSLSVSDRHGRWRRLVPSTRAEETSCVAHGPTPFYRPKLRPGRAPWSPRDEAKDRAAARACSSCVVNRVATSTAHSPPCADPM